jgi:hypothetical protein
VHHKENRDTLSIVYKGKERECPKFEVGRIPEEFEISESVEHSREHKKCDDGKEGASHIEVANGALCKKLLKKRGVNVNDECPMKREENESGIETAKVTYTAGAASTFRRNKNRHLCILIWNMEYKNIEKGIENR